MSAQEQGRPTYTKDDFLSSTAPYEWLYSLSGLRQEQETARLKEEAKALGVGVRQFDRLYKKYREEIKLTTAKPVHDCTVYDKYQKAIGYPILTGEWDFDPEDLSIFRRTMGGGQEIACPHFIAPIVRLVNIDSGMIKIKLRYRQGGIWRDVVVDRSTLASPSRIIELADRGISVTSHNAQALIKYLQDVESCCYDSIPEARAVSRLGWINGVGFAPYDPGIEYDGDINFQQAYEAVSKPAGRYTEWIKTAAKARQESLTARIILAASFASVLVKVCGCLPFFVHLWGTESGTGKTVGLMLATSVWASPENGVYMQSFNSTDVGQERMIEFVNSLPLVLDELQLGKDKTGRNWFSPYKLAQGYGKLRGQKHGGIDRTATWANCILTSGETPLTQSGDGAGAINRVLNIECRGRDPVIRNGRETADALRQNYGHAGRDFMVRLRDEDYQQEAKELYKQFYDELILTDTTEKQAMAAALVLVADHLITRDIFIIEDLNGTGGKQLSARDMAAFLRTRAQVSANERAYQFMLDWVGQNQNRFEIDPQRQPPAYGTDQTRGPVTGDIYGVIKDDIAYIIGQTFNETVSAAGYSPDGFASWLKQEGLIITYAKDPYRNTVKQTVGNLGRINCYALRMEDPRLASEQGTERQPGDDSIADGSILDQFIT